MKFGNLNFMEPSGPLQACNGTALPLPLPIERYFRGKMKKKDSACGTNGRQEICI